MKVSWDTERIDGVLLVRCLLRNDTSTTRRARVQSRLDGPVLPPRRRGVPERGWDADGVTVRLEAGERRAIGFASPSQSADPPIELVDDEPVTKIDDADSGEDGRRTGAAAVRDLGAYRPPRDVFGAGTNLERVGVREGKMTGETATSESGHETNDRTDANTNGAAEGDGTNYGAGDGNENDDGSIGNEYDIDDWFDPIERRIERGERLTDADLSTATEVLASAGGVDAIAGLDERIDRDADGLRQLSDRARALAKRAESTDVPTEALEALA